MKLKIIISFSIALTVLGCGGGGGGGGGSSSSTSTSTPTTTTTPTTLITKSATPVNTSIGSASGSSVYNDSAIKAPVLQTTKQVPANNLNNVLGG